MSAKVRGGNSEKRRHGGQAARGTCKRPASSGQRLGRPPPPARPGPYLRQRRGRGRSRARRSPRAAGTEGAERGGPRGRRRLPGQEPADTGREDTGRHGDLFPAGTAPLPAAPAAGRGRHARDAAAAAAATPSGRADPAEPRPVCAVPLPPPRGGSRHGAVPKAKGLMASHTPGRLGTGPSAPTAPGTPSPAGPPPPAAAEAPGPAGGGGPRRLLPPPPAPKSPPSSRSWLGLPVPVEADRPVPLPGQQAGAGGGPAGQRPAPRRRWGQQGRAPPQEQVPHGHGSRCQHGCGRSVLHVTLQVPKVVDRGVTTLRFLCGNAIAPFFKNTQLLM